MTTEEQAKIQQAKKILTFLLTLEDTEVILAAIGGVIEILEDLN